MPNTAPYDANFTFPEQLHVDQLSFTGDLVTIYASTTKLAAECPLCKQPSRRIPGRYIRTLADLPWCSTPMRLRVRVRKFFCDTPSCERRIFAERLDDVAYAYARSTDRRREALWNGSPSLWAARRERGLPASWASSSAPTPS